jgi:hypothetical protein
MLKPVSRRGVLENDYLIAREFKARSALELFESAIVSLAERQADEGM